MTKAFSPADAAKAHADNIPEAVFDVFNKLLAERYTDGSITITQPEVVAMIVRDTDINRTDLFDKGWLDIEEHYERAGWSVEYDKPGFNEDYEASWTFTPKKKR